MKYLLTLMFLLISINLFSQEFPEIHHGFSLGNLSGYIDMNNNEAQLELFSYRVFESNTGLGLTTYIWPVFSGESLNDDDISFGSNDLFGPEFNWEPFYSPGAFWGSGLFFRVDNYLPGGNDFVWKTGVRLDVRVDFYDFIYPILTVETGYWADEGFYFGIKLDPVVLVAIIGMAVGSEERTQYRKENNPEGFYPNGEPWSDEEPGFGWMPETPEI